MVIPLEDLGDFKHFYITKTPNTNSFWCSFEGGFLSNCRFCFHFNKKEEFCKILKTSTSRCDCRRVLDIRYMYLMNKLKEFMPNIKMKCCVCESEVSWI